MNNVDSGCHREQFKGLNPLLIGILVAIAIIEIAVGVSLFGDRLKSAPGVTAATNV